VKELDKGLFEVVLNQIKKIKCST